MAKQPITAMRLSKLVREQLELMSNGSRLSMTEVVEYLIAQATRRPELRPPHGSGWIPRRGAAWRASRARGSAFLDADLG